MTARLDELTAERADYSWWTDHTRGRRLLDTINGTDHLGDETRRRDDIARSYARRLTVTELVAEIEFLHGTDTPANIAARLGYRDPDSLARRLDRNGHHNLARIFKDRR